MAKIHRTPRRPRQGQPTVTYHATGDWGPERIAHLRALVARRVDCADCQRFGPTHFCRRHNARAIGKALGKSRCAVIGKLNRLPQIEPVEPLPEPEPLPPPRPAAPVQWTNTRCREFGGNGDRCRNQAVSAGLCNIHNAPRLNAKLYDSQGQRRVGVNGTGAR